MPTDVQPNDPPIELLDTARRVVPGWLRRVTTAAATRGGLDETATADELGEMTDRVAADLLERLGQLLHTDVDEQRTTPLSLFREATREPNAWLHERGASLGGQMTRAAFPEDIYALGPATWSDIDPALHEPGLIWGAWKAATVMARRRDEGLR